MSEKLSCIRLEERNLERENKLVSLIQTARSLELDKKTDSFANAEMIMKRGNHIGSHIYCYGQLERTMKKARDHINCCESAGEDFYSGAIILAETLTAAKGRFDRVWHASLGGAWFSVTLASETLPEYHSQYSLTTGVACCELLREYGINANLQWVNNLLVDGKKIGGILLESFVSEMHHETYVLAGIGINVNNNFPAEIPGISAKQILGIELDIDEFYSRLVPKLSFYFGLLSDYESQVLKSLYEDEKKASNPIIESWKSISDTIGRTVDFYEVGRGISCNGKTHPYRAKVVGIDQDGSIILQRKQDDSIIKRNSGELVYVD